jgi:hypothetical protein
MAIECGYSEKEHPVGDAEAEDCCIGCESEHSVDILLVWTTIELACGLENSFTPGVGVMSGRPPRTSEWLRVTHVVLSKVERYPAKCQVFKRREKKARIRFYGCTSEISMLGGNPAHKVEEEFCCTPLRAPYQSHLSTKRGLIMTASWHN